MSRKKISELTATTDLVSGDVFIVNDAGTTKKVDFDVLQEKVRGYKIYSAYVDWDSGSGFTTTVLENTLDNTITVTNDAGLEYLTKINSTAAFTANKTSIQVSGRSTQSLVFGTIQNVQYSTSSLIQVYNLSESASDLNDKYTFYIEIKVYE